MQTIFKIFIEFVTTIRLFCFVFFFGHKACEILAPHLGLGICTTYIGMQSLNHWTAREFPQCGILNHTATRALLLEYMPLTSAVMTGTHAVIHG